MKTFFRELFQYNHNVNQRLLAVLAENPEISSGNSIKFLSHIINVHQIWNCRILPGRIPSGNWEIHSASELYEMDKLNLETSLQIINDFEMDRVVKYANAKGQIYNDSIRDLLFNIINHSTYHRGQTAIEFRQSGIRPLLTDYIFYKWNESPRGK